MAIEYKSQTERIRYKFLGPATDRMRDAKSKYLSSYGSKRGSVNDEINFIKGELASNALSRLSDAWCAVGTGNRWSEARQRYLQENGLP